MIFHDLRFALRLLVKDRWSSAGAIIALALGIGANATGFSIVNASFLRGLPFDEVDRLFVGSWQTKEHQTRGVSPVELETWRAQARTMEVAALREETVTIGDDVAVPEQVYGAALTSNLFDILRQRPLIGRDFEPSDEAPAAQPVVIIGFNLWQRRYRSDPAILGKTLRANGTPSTIVGVMPRGMRFPEHADVWTPFIPPATQQDRENPVLSVIGRLNDGVDIRQARAEMSGIARLETFTEAFFGGTAKTMFVTVMCAVVFVLLIACVNVANLLLARSVSRTREIALRLALGATRWRVVHQLLAESLLLAFIGGGLGLGLALWGVDRFERAMQVSDKPYWLIFSIDPVVVAYVAGICVLTALFCGMAPALQVFARTSYEVLKEGNRGVTSSRRAHWFSGSMVVAELALTLILVAGASLMMSSFLKLYTLDVGIDTDRVLAMEIALPSRTYASIGTRRVFFDRLLADLAVVPGLESAAVTTAVPPRDDGERLLEVDSSTNSNAPRFVSTVRIGPRYFEVVGRPLLRGRTFHDRDGLPGAETVIVNERLAAQFFPGEDPIGRQIRFTTREPRPEQPREVWRTIVGISRPIRHGSPQDAYLGPVVYIPYRQDAPRSASLLVKSRLSSAAASLAVRQTVQAIDRDQPVFSIQTIEELRSTERWPQRVFGSLFAILALAAVALSVVGLYGVMSHAVAERTQEIGVRIAVGAPARRVGWLVVRRGLIQLAIGVPLGIAGAVALGVVLQSLLVDMSPIDPVTLITSVLILVGVTIAGCLIPAHRATRVDPMVVLK